jgi:hypothetical protein
MVKRVSGGRHRQENRGLGCLVILFMEPEASLIVESGMDLSSEQRAELRELAGPRDVPADVALRARIVLWSGEGRRRKDIAELAGVPPLTVDRCKARCAAPAQVGLVRRHQDT